MITECVHEFAPPSKDPLRRCTLCGIVGRGPRDRDGLLVEPGFFELETRRRGELFRNLRAPVSVHGQKR